MPNISNLVKKTDYNTEISDIDARFFNTSDYNKFTGEILNAKLKKRIS